MGLPTGPAVTFMFTDIEGSTRLERAAGSAAWAGLVARHDDLLREAIERYGGVVVKTEGDAFFAAFAEPLGGASAAVAAQRAIAGEPWPPDVLVRVRMGLHLGEGRLRQGSPPGAPEDYVGIDVNYAARIAAVGNGGQIVVSDPLAVALGGGFHDRPELAEVVLTDAGLRAVKDFEEPARLYRLVVPRAAEDTRELRTLDVPSNLPGELTGLVGREAELGTLRDLLGANRVVTVTGPGGSGKTRLALGAAKAVVNDFPHGVWFIDLAAVRDPTLLVSVVGAVLGVRESPEETAAEALGRYLRNRTALLVLDNLEQLLPDGAAVVAGILRDAPDVRALITSRELLRISGERGYPVPPLSTDSGVALFVERATTQRPGLVLGADDQAAIRSIAERLGGLPLAIELAAARIRLLSPRQILDRLGQSLDLGGGNRDLPERQRTLRGAIDWSYELLSDPERRLFRRLAVFAGGWTLEAALEVADPDAELGIDLPDGLESLADKSLIRVEVASQAADAEPSDVRYGLHPLLREFALEQLTGSGERADLERRHAAEIADIAQAAGATIFGTGGETSLVRLDREEHNIRAAIAWSLANDPVLGLRIVSSIWRWFQQRGRLREGRAVLAQLLAQTPPDEVGLRIAGLAAEGGLAYWMNDFDGARIAYDERLRLATGTGDPVLMADAHHDLGFLSMVAQDGPELLEHEQRAHDLYVEAGREDGVIRARQGLALALFLAGDYPGARTTQEANIEAFRAAGSQLEIADGEVLLSAIYLRLGDPTSAWERMVGGLRFFAETDSASGLARSLCMAAIIEIQDGDPAFGGRIAGATYELAREKSVMLAPVKVLHLPEPRDLLADRLEPEVVERLLAEGGATARVEVIAEIIATGPPGRAEAQRPDEATASDAAP
jgi:predicted ATPase/class 3 adenylate cyclase